MATRKRGPYGPYSPEETRKRLIDAGVYLFGEGGFLGTSVQMIAQRAGVTKGGFYHHFESKDDLLRQIHYEYASRMLANMREIGYSDSSAVDQLRAIIRCAAVTVGNYRWHVAIFYQEYRYLNGSSYDSIRKMHNQETSIVYDVIERGIANGEFDSAINPKLLLFSISAITAWIYQWYDPAGPMSLDAIADGIADIILKGAEAPKRSSAPRGGTRTVADKAASS
jgi:TetR/AcrR family transcriptional regulator, cholesterol catabolism regulator